MMTRQYDDRGKTIRRINNLILCTKCNTYLPAEAFTESMRDGYSYCKECIRKKNLERKLK